MSSEPSTVIASERGLVVPRFDFILDFLAQSSRGASRAVNQDAVLCRPELGVFAVADGMGGHAAGEVAARTALDGVEEHLSLAESRRVIEDYAALPHLENRRAVFALLCEAVEQANRAVLSAADRHLDHEGMGTTLDVAMLVGDRAFIAHVGDARVFLARPSATLQLTHDHSTFDTLRTSGKRGAPRRARGPIANSVGDRRGVSIDTVHVDLTSDDRLVLCTDGVFSPLEGDLAFTSGVRRGDATSIGTALLDRARANDPSDDASLVVMVMGERLGHHQGDSETRARDLEILKKTPLLLDLAHDDVAATLAAAVEIELEAGVDMPRAVANDRVAYLVLDGVIALASRRTLGASAFVMAESLLDIPGRGALPKVVERARLLRIRHDDFIAVCSHDSHLAARLYQRIARHLATSQ